MLGHALGVVRQAEPLHKVSAERRGKPSHCQAEDRRDPAQPRLSIVGSNWGGARKRRPAAAQTRELLEHPAHIQLVLELCDEQVLPWLKERGWDFFQKDSGGPAILWLRSNFTAVQPKDLTILSSTGKYAGQVVKISLVPTRPGFRVLKVAAAHMHHEVQEQNSK